MKRFAKTRKGRILISKRAADDAQLQYVHPVPSQTRALGNVFSINDGARRPSVIRSTPAPVFQM